MPSRRSAGGGDGAGGGGGTTRRKRSLGNLRRAHPASGATWNVQVVRGKMSSKCLWHACRALALGLTLMMLGAGMATIGYYADHLSMTSEVRGNATVRFKNDLKGFHLNNFSYAGPIVMGFGGFIVVASCVMTFEARDSAAKVMPARLRSGTVGSATSTRRTIGMQRQSSRWDQQVGVFRSSPAAEAAQPAAASLDRDALTAELRKFSKSLSASARLSPQLRRLTFTGSVPNLSTHALHPLAYSTNISQLLSPNHKPLLLPLLEAKRHHRHHRHHHLHLHFQYPNLSRQPGGGRQPKLRGARFSSSLIQRTTREGAGGAGAACSLLQPPSSRLVWHAASFDESGRAEKQLARYAEHNRRSDTAKRHVLARQRPIEHEEEKGPSPLGNRRSSTMSESSYNGRWMASRTPSIDSRRIQVDLHSPEVMPKSILRSPKRLNSGPSQTPSVEKEFRSQLSVCSEPPATIRQLSGQSSLEPCFPEEGTDLMEERTQTITPDHSTSSISSPTSVHTAKTAAALGLSPSRGGILKKSRPDSLPLMGGAAILNMARPLAESHKQLQRSSSSRTFYRPKPRMPHEHDDSIFYIRSEQREGAEGNDFHDSLRVINERRTTLLLSVCKSAAEERKASRLSLMQEIPERVVVENGGGTPVEPEDRSATSHETKLQIESDPEGGPEMILPTEASGDEEKT